MVDSTVQPGGQSAKMEPFEYKPLDLEGRSFRLLMLHQADVGDITCDIFEASLESDSIIPYEALSYAWGSLDLPESITANGKTLRITKNLYSALEHLRRLDNRILWIDAICIDQTNLQERGHQVGQMGDIYKHAERVLVWLGPSTYETKVLMDSLQKLQRECSRQTDWDDLDSLREKWVSIEQKAELDYAALLDIQRKGLTSLLDQPWFNRVWVLQEVANAHGAMVCCGKWSIRAHVFAAAPRLLGIDPTPQRQAVINFMPGPSRKRAVSKKSLHALLQDFRGSQATDPRDMVYALLGLTDLGNDLLPDYTKTEAQLVHDLQCLLFFGEDTAQRLGEYVSMRQFLYELPALTDIAFKDLIAFGHIEEVEELLRRGESFCVTGTSAISTRRFGRAGDDESDSGDAAICCLLQIKNPNLTFSERCIDQMFTWCSVNTISLLLEREGERLRLMREMAHVLSGGLGVQPDVKALLNEWYSGRDIEVTQEGFETLVMRSNKEALATMFERRNDTFRITAGFFQEAEYQNEKLKPMLIFLLTHYKDRITFEPQGIVWLAGMADAELSGLLLPVLRLQEIEEITLSVFDQAWTHMVAVHDWSEESTQMMSRATKKTLYKWNEQGIIRFGLTQH